MAKNFPPKSYLANYKAGGEEKLMKALAKSMGKKKANDIIEQAKYGTEKLMPSSTMSGMLDKAMGGYEMMMKKKGGQVKYPQRGMRAKNAMRKKKK